MSSLLRAVPLHLPSSPERSLDGWSSGMRRALCGGCGSLQRLKIICGMETLQNPNADAQKCAGAELIAGPVPD